MTYSLNAIIADMDGLTREIRDLRYRLESPVDEDWVAKQLEDLCILAADSFMKGSSDDLHGETTLFAEISSRLPHIGVPKCPICYQEFEVAERQGVHRALSGFLTTDQTEKMAGRAREFCGQCFVREMASVV